MGDIEELQELIKYCIDNFSIEEASSRITRFILDSIELKEKELELKILLKP